MEEAQKKLSQEKAELEERLKGEKGMFVESEEKMSKLNSAKQDLEKQMTVIL